MARIVKPVVKYINEPCWILPDVKVERGIHTYHIMKEMAKQRTFHKMAEYSAEQKEAGNPYVPNSIEGFSILKRAGGLGDKSLIAHLQSGLERWPWFISLVGYNPVGEVDEVIHNYGASDTYTLKGNIVGADDWIEEISDKKVLRLFFGTRGVKTINNVSQAINQTPTYVTRFNKKPEKREERGVRLFAYSVRLLLFADRFPSLGYPGFRVERVE